MPKTEDFLLHRMLSVYLNIQVTPLLENTTLYKCLALPKYIALNLPFACQLEVLLSLNIFLEFPFSISEMAKVIHLVRMLDNEGFWKFMIELCNEF